MPRFVLKDMETLYVDEVRASISLLYNNLESVPVSTSRGVGTQMRRNNKSRFIRIYGANASCHALLLPSGINCIRSPTSRRFLVLATRALPVALTGREAFVR